MGAALYEQDLDLAILLRLYAGVTDRTMIDVGAERGAFVDAFLSAGCSRVDAFEPYAPHARHLRDRFGDEPAVRVFEMALGARDEPAVLHLAHDKAGREYGYYHSLASFADTREVSWGRGLPVTCRTLGSLVADGTLPREIGVLKVDTEGYDLEVIRGMGPLSPAIVMVEYWDSLPEIFGHCPYSLAELGEALGARGFSHAVVVKRREGLQAVQVDSFATTPGDWGNAIFVHDSVHAALAPVLTEVAAESLTKLMDTAIDLQHHAGRRLDVINELKRQAEAARLGQQRRLAPRIGVLRHHRPRPLDIPDRYREARVPAPPPKISIVTATLDAGRFLERTIRSVLNQGYPNLEYVIQDGGSTDGSPDILERYREVLASVEVAKDDGQADAINRGFARTTGDVMAYLNGDDLLLPGSLAYVAEFFARYPAAAVYAHRVLIDEDDREIDRWVLPRHDRRILAWADYVPQESLFWRRRLWERAGGRLDASFHFAMDWELLSPHRHELRHPRGRGADALLGPAGAGGHRPARRLRLPGV